MSASGYKQTLAGLKTTSALHPGADLSGGVAEGPFLTQRERRGEQSHGAGAILQPHQPAQRGLVLPGVVLAAHLDDDRVDLLAAERGAGRASKKTNQRTFAFACASAKVKCTWTCGCLLRSKATTNGIPQLKV